MSKNLYSNFKTGRILTAVFFVLCLSLSSRPLFAQDAGTHDKAALEKTFPKRAYSPYAGRNFPTRPYFGDTHLHTGFSMDAGAFGARLNPKDAYRFARGEEVMASSNQPVKLSRPLDFFGGRRPFRQHGVLPGPLCR